MPRSFRFPPLREGNQAARLFGSPCGQGNHKEGVAITAIFYELWLCNW